MEQAIERFEDGQFFSCLEQLQSVFQLLENVNENCFGITKVKAECFGLSASCYLGMQ